jgi:NTP pyrophosphatase (non-canonical NTP hydrolase)
VDRLTEIFARQLRLQQVIHHYDIDVQTDEQRIHSIKENVLACTDELHEALHEVGWKQWATSRHINEDALKGEIIDAFHFILNLALHAGMDSEEFFRRFIEKNQRNFERQAEGYDGISSKCPHCARALDDVGVDQGRILGELVFTCGGCRKGLDTKQIIGQENLERIVRITKILDTAT